MQEQCIEVGLEKQICGWRCGAVEDGGGDMEHFLQECGGQGELQEMSGMEEVPICELLLFGVRREKAGDKYRRYIGRLWTKREEILKLHEDQPA